MQVDLEIKISQHFSQPHFEWRLLCFRHGERYYPASDFTSPKELVTLDTPLSKNISQDFSFPISRNKWIALHPAVDKHNLLACQMQRCQKCRHLNPFPNERVHSLESGSISCNLPVGGTNANSTFQNIVSPCMR